MTKSILVTNSTDDGGIVAMRSLSKSGCRIISTDFRRLPFDLRPRYSLAHYLVRGSDQDHFESDLLELVDQVAPDVLLPIGHRATLAASRHLEQFSQKTSLNVPSLDSFKTADKKPVCLAECRALKIPCPESYAPSEAIQLLEQDDQDLTLVVKPAVNSGGAVGVSYVRQPAQLQRALRSCSGRFGEATIEEYVPGGPQAMTAVLLLFSRDSQLDCAFTLRKTRQWPTKGGQTAAAVSTEDRHLVELVLPFFEKQQWRGPAEVEFKFDHRDGQHKVIEINPRFPMYLRFAVHCGLDLPQRAIELALREGPLSPRPFPDYRTGAKYAHPYLYLRALLSDIRSPRSGFRALRKAAAELRGSRSVLMGMLEDPVTLFSRRFARDSLSATLSQ